MSPRDIWKCTRREYSFLDALRGKNKILPEAWIAALQKAHATILLIISKEQKKFIEKCKCFLREDETAENIHVYIYVCTLRALCKFRLFKNGPRLFIEHTALQKLLYKKAKGSSFFFL